MVWSALFVSGALAYLLSSLGAVFTIDISFKKMYNIKDIIMIKGGGF